MILTSLIELQHAAGTLRLSTLTWNWDDPEGRTWLGGGRVLSFDRKEATADEVGGALTFKWSGATQDLIDLSLDPSITRAPVRVWTITLDEIAGELVRTATLDSWSGYAETPEIGGDPSEPEINLVAQPVLIDLGEARSTPFSRRAIRAIDANDTGGDFIETLVDATVTFDGGGGGGSGGGGGGGSARNDFSDAAAGFDRGI